MKQTLRLLGGLALLSIAGCQFNKPPAGYLTAWEKNGVTDFTEVGKALLECGMPTPYDVFPENRNLSNNAWATIEACMIQAGFRDKVGGGTWCENHKVENLPICRPGAVIPQRSVKKRLNSPFCKKHPEQYECQP
ncbi:hypothetical protein [Bartonella henselae]|uniref:Hypothetical genomic island protein n=1 Tax=Bartonella henselae (strain ATCC 49882 / DSM 28221 / CCUG 30454 / Houston 1) TaxID=283166 RepID=A0A0H3M353_BARHE|nr:hypothetical protein [Bartonella henselae]ATP13142.1 hypothetical protein BhenCHDE101_04730 [Bartonella henselae]ETS04104.1 hypothetical protein Q655_01630 [Bartonella henselae JK 51]ETS10890.1 hypothetical protein Q654_00038 [Bartonella henselae JK 50]PNM39386.1 hypothetical protein AL470_003995 [Bartonella henselae str. Houston-1]UAK84989.1 hypothetical protein K8O99_02845 [Bartonella henselae]